MPCETQTEQYIGNTKRKLTIRIKEHQKSCNKDLSDIQPDFKNDNGIPYHVATTGHTFEFHETKILDREKNYFKRKTLEGMSINKTVSPASTSSVATESTCAGGRSSKTCRLEIIRGFQILIQCLKW